MKFKTGSRVVPTKKTINWYVTHEEIYHRPSHPETVDVEHLSELCYWRAAKLGHVGKGSVTQVQQSPASAEKLYYVKLTSKFGEATAWFEPKDLEPMIKYKAPKSL